MLLEKSPKHPNLMTLSIKPSIDEIKSRKYKNKFLFIGKFLPLFSINK
jgi:hypothetical protein